MPSSNGDAFILQHRADRIGYVLILPGNQPWPFLDDRYLRTETTIGLAEFQPDIAPADHDEMVGQAGEVEQRTVGEQGNLADARHVREQRASADIHEDPFGRKHVLADPDLLRPLEAGLAEDQRASRKAAKPFLVAVAAIRRDLLRARMNACHVDADRPGDHAEIGAVPREMRGIGRGDQRLGGLATGVHAGAAHQMAFDDRDRHSGR
jgi:hypothetical protein